jgi:hypothetical protein
MAKVRIQARSADIQDIPMHHDHPPYLNENHKKQRKHAGALDVLAGVWKREGYFGWYQVCVLRSAPFRIKSDLDFLYTGYASPDNESCSFASSALHVERAI